MESDAPQAAVKESRISIILQVLFTILVWGSVYFVLRYRNLAETLKFGAGIGSSLFFVLLGIRAVTEMRERGRIFSVLFAPILSPIRTLKFIFLYLLGGILIGLLIYCLIIGASELGVKIGRLVLQGTVLSTVGAVAVVLALGTAFFWFRLKVRALYGATEALAGVAIGVSKLQAVAARELANPDLLFAILTASVYLVVRGFDNVHVGLTKAPLDHFSKKWLDWLLRRGIQQPAPAPTQKGLTRDAPGAHR